MLANSTEFSNIINLYIAVMELFGWNNLLYLFLSLSLFLSFSLSLSLSHTHKHYKSIKEIFKPVNSMTILTLCILQ